jgi:hypothetical protein
MLLLVIVFQAVALDLPWYTFTHSTGRTLPPEYPSKETGENVSRRDYYPYSLRGDVNQTERADAATVVRDLGVLASVPLVFAVVALVVEALWGGHDWARWPGMALSVLGLGVTVAALLYMWFFVPPTLAQQGVHHVFVNHAVKDGYIRSSLGWGWVVSALALMGYLAHFAFRYQQGSFDLSFVERLRDRRH